MTITIPSSLPLFDVPAFEGCDSLESIKFCKEVNDFMVTNLIHWWNSPSFYEEVMHYSPSQLRNNMFAEQVTTNDHLRSLKMMSRLSSLELRLQEHIIQLLHVIQLLHDIPLHQQILEENFCDIYCR